MSWDVILFNERPFSWDDVAEDWEPTLMGTGEELRARISAHLPGVDWSDTKWGFHSGDGFSLELNVPATGPIGSILICVGGGGDPLPDLIRLAKSNDWSIMDGSDSSWIDLENPRRDNWEQYKRYATQIRRQKNVRAPEDDSS